MITDAYHFYVLAKDLDSFLSWCDAHGSAEAILVQHPNQLKNVAIVRKSQVVYYGAWWLHPNTFDIHQQLKISLLTAKE